MTDARTPVTPAPRASGRRGVLAAVALGTLLPAVGCSAHFRPTVPMRARSSGIELQLESVRLGRSASLTYRSRSQSLQVVQRAWISAPFTAPCSVGIEATQIVVDGRADGGGALSPGTHEVVVTFRTRDDRNEGADVDGGSETTWNLGGENVLDLETVDGACVRAPAVSQSIPLAGSGRVVLAGSMLLDGNTDLSGLTGMFGGRVGGGVWLGRVLATAEAGVGGAMCNFGSCGKRDDGGRYTRVTFPAEASVRYSLGPVLTNAALTNFVMVGARYAFAPVELPAMEGERKFLVHAFQGVLSWAFRDTLRGPFVNLERTPMFEVAIPIGVVVAPNGPTSRVGFGAGMSLRFLIPL
jgi:hypothetical protein